jgi:glycosyltransferase involved in cell wall biosynthesis
MITEKIVHIVALDVPWPADYGGRIEIFYKIKTLHKLGVKIHLHCFTPINMGSHLPQDELKKYCLTITYYQRKKNSSSFSLHLPLIVKSRKNDRLINNLKKDDYPVLLEGIHCTYYLYNNELKNRKIIVRLHNAEFEYYKHLAKHENNFFKKIYFLHESKLLKKYEAAIAKKAVTLALSERDADLYQHLLGATQIGYMPAFTPYTLAMGKQGKGNYCLYHGNLTINENEEAATWLLQHVFNTLQIPFVIAGKKPSQKLIDLAHQHQHTCLVQNPTDKEMQDLISKAQVHILPSFNNTGIKLKLLNALFNGRHVVVNKQGVEGSGLEEACHIATNAASFKNMIEKLYHQSFTDDDIQLRQGLLQRKYNNNLSIKKVTDIFWKGEEFLRPDAGVI